MTTDRQQLAAPISDQAVVSGAAHPFRQPTARRRSARRFRWRWVVALLPTLVATVYYGLVATDRFVSEAQLVVRRAADDGAPKGGLASLLRLGSGSFNELSVVGAYVTSRDAVTALKARLPLAQIFGPPRADIIARWPSLYYGPTDEQFYRYYQTMVQAIPQHEKGILTISVQTFEPADSRAIALALVQLAEALANRMNERMLADSVRNAEEEVARSEETLIAAQVAVTEFRTREMVLDPERNAVLLAELIGKLNTELATTQTQIEQLGRIAPNTPGIAPLQSQAASLRQQIEAQRSVISTGDAALAGKIAEYERLNLQQQFASRRLASTVASLAVAKNQARRQQIYVERIVEPGLPDKSTMPRSFLNVLTVFGWSMLLYLVLWTVVSGMREHAAQERT
jgi:capsular polysaccharide transport system permease protein